MSFHFPLRKKKFVACSDPRAMSSGGVDMNLMTANSRNRDDDCVQGKQGKKGKKEKKTNISSLTDHLGDYSPQFPLIRVG
jgi:hypothetical protein